jgi:hypothetical protein
MGRERAFGYTMWAAILFGCSSPPSTDASDAGSGDPGEDAGCATGADGRCLPPACAQGYADCDGDPANGCETAIASDPANCGGCGTACGSANTTSAPTCVSGECEFACAPDFLHCGPESSSGCETSIRANAAHCGACGRSCLAGACDERVCQPFVLAANQDSPVTITTDTEFVYWMSSRLPSMVMRSRRDKTCTTAVCPEVFAETTPGGGAMAADGKRVYWSADEAVYQKDVATGVVTSLGSPVADPRSLAVAEPYVFWERPVQGGVLYSKIDGSPADLKPFVRGEGGANFVAVDGPFLYWTTPNAIYQRRITDGPCDLPTGVEPCPALLTGIPPSRPIAFDSTNIYWAETEGTATKRVMKMPKLGGTPAAVATNQVAVTSVASDGVNVYWGHGETSVYRTAKVTSTTACDDATCPVFSDAGKGPAKIYADDKGIYWVFATDKDDDGTKGLVMMQAR